MSGSQIRPVRGIFSGRRKLVAVVLVLLAVVAGWKLLGRGGGRPGMNMDAPPVRVATSLAQNVPHFLNGLGTVLPSGDVLVTSRVDGQLQHLHFAEGQRVKAGDLLAEIDPRPFQASLDQALGNLAKDRAQLENARNDLARYAKLAQGNYIAAQQYETQRALVRQFEGVVRADQAAVDSARLQLEYSRVTAPISGRLGLRNVDEGNMIKASDANGLVRITEISPCDVIFTLPESQVPLVVQALRHSESLPGSPPLLVQAWDREQKRLLAVGQLLSLDNQIDSATGTVRLKASFANKDGALYPNQFVNARLLVRILPGAVTVPASAVQLGTRGAYVYVVRQNEKGPGEKGQDEAQICLVTPGVSSGGLTVIDKGLEPGERVVVDGLDRLRDGTAVRVAATVETPRAESVDGTVAADPGAAQNAGQNAGQDAGQGAAENTSPKASQTQGSAPTGSAAAPKSRQAP
ncbi:MdtA/MuxA family multidrug efflux RND transporter periplasmic adaptor subunit [Desulfovibrio sp. 86]|uniref:Multidrug efflux system, subunit A n=1 Tax=uncultured Desulfovibrio sp. TaxID=167968 RepID=A0A212L8U7_9BACT|nr:MdtA/MuxA family multidrug efflux RND transporter periplasmic adaptor subunit [Desulfovibrio sp. 86]SCM73991.1 multidrug efflux system, subunit A [uncultured Desulfovibrio sp.]VZH34571.1 Multidrug resistance protein MdtA [Desulfovibrio sp. 86]